MPSQPPVRRRGPPPGSPAPGAGPRRFVIEPVEPRLLYSADFAAAFSGGAAGVGGLFDERRLEAPELQAPPLQAAPRAEIALVDGRLPAADGRLAELQARRQAGQPLEVVTLQPGDDGIARATELLRGRADVGALHLVGRSADGALQLGRATLDAPTLLARAGELAAWGQALAPGAQLLLTGSDGPAGSAAAALRAGLAALTGAEVAAAAPRALIVVAANLPDSAQLVAGLRASSPGDVEVLVLAADRDGLAQIGERLAQAGRPFDAVHLVSHAAPGRVDLGTTVGDRWLDEATLQARHEELARWSTGFTADGDLLLYGCDLAGSAAGERLLAGLGATLGVDVAASTDATGAAAQGADWALEYRLGEVAAAAPLAATAWTFTLQVSVGGPELDPTPNTPSINVTPVNDAPVNALPANVYTALNTARTFSTANDNALQISDTDAASGTMQFTLTASQGTVSLSSTTGLTLTAGSNGASTFTYTGTLSAINTAMGAGVTFTPTNGFRGLAQLTLQTSDLGNSGSGSALTDSDTLNLHAGAIVVTTTNDTSNGTTTSIANLVASDGGDGISLREAISAANATAGTDTITFNISGTGVHTIDVLSALPTIIDAVMIDGWSEPDFAGTPIIEINGASAGNVIGLDITAGNSTVRGLTINRFLGYQIRLSAGGGNTLVGNYLNVDATGMSLSGGGTPLLISNSDGNVIGGATAAERNILSGNAGTTFRVRIESGSDNNVLTGNYIGTNATGMASLGSSGGIGIAIYGGTGNRIGGIAPGEGNVISGNGGRGIFLQGAGVIGTIIQGNYIGVAADGTTALGNSQGIRIQQSVSNTLVGGAVGGAGNVIAFNGSVATDSGIEVTGSGSLGNSFLGNSIYGNAGLAIDLNDNGVTNNDLGDGDPGPNRFQNFPVLTGAVSSGGNTIITGSLNSTATKTFRIEFFSSPTGDATGYGEARTYLGFTIATTDNAGNALINSTLSGVTLTAGHVVSATATVVVDLLAGSYGDTSEFAQNVTAAVVNSAPALDNAKSPALTAQNEDSGAPTGAVGTLISSLVDLASPSGQVDNVTDPDSGALLGIAVTATDTANGGWYYSTNGGTNWNAMGAVASNSARLLAADANTRIYFQPSANQNGTLSSAITFRAWDQTSGTNGALADTSSNGGTSAFSSATDVIDVTVTAVNDAPTLALGTTVSSWVEGQSPVTLDAALVLGDVDHTLLGSARIAITGGFTAGDRLQVTPPVGVMAAYNHNTGVLTLTGQATLAEYQAALRSVAFSSESEHPTSAGITRTVSWTIKDGALDSAPQTSTVTVTGVNDAPSGADKTIAIVEDTSYTVQIADFGFTDVDASLFTGVYIATPPGASNVLALDGYAVSAGQWVSVAQIADGKLRFTPAADANGPNLANFTFRVQDDGGMVNGGVDTDATPNRLSFDVTAVNDAPTITPFADLLLNEDFSTQTISFTVGDADSVSSALTVTAVSSDTSIVQPPTLSGASADRTIRLQSMANAFGTATVTVTVSDGVNSTSTSFTVQVSPLNDAPQVVGTSATLAAVAEDTPSPAGRLISDLLAANYSDARDGIYATPMAGVAVVGIEGSDERGSWQYSAGGSTGWTSMPSSGLSEASAVVLPSTYWLRFLPAPNFNGDPGALRLRLADSSQGAIALPTVQDISGNRGGTKVWSASSVSLKTDVVAVNDRPEALGPATLPAIDEDTASPPGVRVDELFVGSYTDAADADQRTDLAGVAIVGNAATAAQGQWQHSANGTDGWTAIRTSGLSDGAALVLPASHWLRFVPSANWSGTPGELSVRLADGSQGAVNLATEVDLTDGLGETGIWSDGLVPLGTEVTPVNDAPVAADDTQAIAEDGTLNGSVAGLVTDVDGSSLSYAIVGDTPAGLVFDTATGAYTYTPAANFHGALSFQYKASDGVADSNVATVSITVTPVNDAPVIELPPDLQARANSPLQLIRGPAGLRITDVDATTFTVTLTTTGGVPIRLVPDSLDDLISHSGNGTDTVTLEGTKINVNRAVDGMILDIGASGSIDLTVTVSDNGGAGAGGPQTTTASSRIVVTPGAMPQVTTTAGPVTFTEGDPGLLVDPGLTVSDSDSGLLTQARVTIMLRFRAGDLLQATSLPGGITQSWDEDGKVLTLSGTTSVANYQAALRSVTFSNSSQSPSTATRTLAFVVDDGNGPSLASTREVQVVAVNDAPTLALPIADQSATEDTAFAFTVPAITFADVDAGDTLVYTATQADGTALPSWLSFDAATRRFSGTPSNGDVGPVVLHVTATDSAGAQASGSFTLTVANANDAPTLAVPMADQSATEDGAFAFTVPANTFADVDAGDTLVYTATQADGTALPAWLSFDAATRRFSGTPSNGDVGPVVLRVTATDSAGAQASGTFTLTVANANDAPMLAAPIAAQTATEGSIFTFAVPANTFDDVDAGDALAYTATQADGTALPAWLRFDAATMGFRGAPQRLDAGPLDIRVTATDRAGQSAAGDFRIDVVALPFVPPAPAAPTSPAPVIVAPAPAPAPAPASSPVAMPPPAAMPAPAPAPSPAADPASTSLTSGGRAPSPEPATSAPIAAPAPANAPSSSASRAPASDAAGASESPAAAAPAGAKAQESSPDAQSGPAPAGDGAKAAATAPGDAGAVVAKEPAGAVAANATATAGGPGAPAGQAAPAVNPGANPAADAVAAVGRWVAGSGLGGSLAAPAPVQPSLSWAPIGQLGLERGAFDSALGLGSSSSGDSSASQRVDNSFRQLREDAQEEAVVEQGVVASSVVVSTGFSVGYVLWLARGGALLASLASAIPAWAMVDPMPVLSKQRPGGGRGPHAQGPDPDADNDGMGAPDDEVEDMFDAGSRAGAPRTPPPLATPPLPAAATQPAVEARS